MQIRLTLRFAGLAAMLALLLVVGPYALAVQGAVQSSTVSGQLNEQFAKHYLGLRVVDTSQSVTIKLEYQPQNTHLVDENAGFYVFKQSGFDKYINAAPPSESVFVSGSLDTMDGIKRKVAEIGANDASDIVTIVVYNDTTLDFSYTLIGENVEFIDESGEQVVGGSTPEVPETATPTPAGLQSASAVQAVVTTSAVRSSWAQGNLNEQFDKHYLGLEIIDTGQPATVKMEYDPQDSQPLDDSSGFYVFKQAGFDRYVNAAPPSESVFLTGSLDSMGGVKRKVVEVGVDDVADIVTLVTFNDTTVPLSYTLIGENILFLDDSGEQVEGDRVVITQPGAAAGDLQTLPGGEIASGGTYTVREGDTLGTISSSAYGTTAHWNAICNVNSLDNCDIIEVGDVLTIPEQQELGSVSAAPVATPTPADDAMAGETPSATPEATEEAMPESTAVATAEATVAATPAATAEAMPEPTSDSSMTTDNLIEVAEDYEDLDILLLALDLAGLTSSISDGGPFTVFAPTNAAFASLPEARLDLLMADSALLASTLRYHVVSGTLTAADLASQTTLTTLHGSTIDISTSSDGSPEVEGITIVRADVKASNGVIHFIHQLLPDPDDSSSQ